jgi:CheY-like chemotaxis protein/HPt (histidine-containing phosphotransfer) domain-containing protein/anti-sigma regulatory factor (Ser/Thr protein kinase)
MNAIKGMSDLLLLTPLSDVQHNYVHNILGAVDSLLTIVNDILDFSKIDTNRLEIVNASYDFGSLISDIANVTNLKASEKRLDFILDLDPFIPALIVGDHVRIKQILLNLLNNALKSTSVGYIKLSVRCKEDQGNIELSCLVEDSGSGVPEKDIPKLFQSFEQLDFQRDYGMEGSGLGLPISYRLVELMGGHFEVESHYGEGSAFSFTIPQKIGSQDHLAVVNTPEQKNVLLYAQGRMGEAYGEMLRRLFVPFELCQDEKELAMAMARSDYTHVIYSYADGHKLIERYAPWRYGSRVFAIKNIKFVSQQPTDANVDAIFEPVFITSLARALNKIKADADESLSSAPQKVLGDFKVRDVEVLIVDDNQINLLVAEELLRHYDIEPDMAESGAEALEKVQAKKYDLIFMDHMMPEMDGIEVTHRIRLMGLEYSSLPIVALTANAVSGMRELFLQNSLNDFLSKPIELDELNRVLRAWLPDEKIVLENKVADVSAEPPKNEMLETGVLHAVALDLKDDLDITGALTAIGGSQETYLSILRVFAQTLPNRLVVLDEHKKASDWNAFRVEVHGLKSALANIGAKRLSLQARALESASQDTDVAHIEAHYPDFIEHVSRLAKLLRTVLEKDRSSDAPKELKTSRDDAENLDIKLREAGHLLDALEQDLVAELLNDLMRYSYGSSVDKLLQDVRQAVDFFDYDAAVSGIQDCLGVLSSR